MIVFVSACGIPETALCVVSSPQYFRRKDERQYFLSDTRIGFTVWQRGEFYGAG
jgi:hypothetical protein